MTLLTVRTLFATHSGRFDLVDIDDEYSDSGADFFINAGMRMLDRLTNFGKSFSRHYVTLAAGDWYAIIPYCRAIKEVWLSNDVSRTLITKKDLSSIRQVYASPISALDQGTVLYYSPASIRTTPEPTGETDSITIDKFGTVTYSESGSSLGYNGLIFMPPADGAFTLEVYGLFSYPDLSDDDDENFWTEQHPDILLLAALYKLETFNRNTEGAKDWMNALTLEVSELDKDNIEQEISDINQIEG
jgi:hypothetical protein